MGGQGADPQGGGGSFRHNREWEGPFGVVGCAATWKLELVLGSGVTGRPVILDGCGWWRNHSLELWGPSGVMELVQIRQLILVMFVEDAISFPSTLCTRPCPAHVQWGWRTLGTSMLKGQLHVVHDIVILTLKSTMAFMHPSGTLALALSVLQTAYIRPTIILMGVI